MTFNSQLSVTSKTSSLGLNSKKEAPNLVLTNGTEVYEVESSFSVNSLIDISFPHRRPIRHNDELYKKLDQSIHYEHINCYSSKMSYIGGTFGYQPLEPLASQAPYKKSNALKNLPNKETICHEYYHDSLLAQFKKDLQQPLAKYHHLMNQVTNFCNDLSQYLKEQDEDQNEKHNIQLVLSAIQAMQSELQTIRDQTKFDFIFEKNFNQFSVLNQHLIQSFNKLSSDDYKEKLKNNKPLKPEDQDPNQQTNENEWVIYSKTKPIKTCGTVDAQYLNLEQRISQIENSMGFVADMKNPFPDVLNAVAFLEGRYEYTFHVIFKIVLKCAERMSSNLKNIKYHLDLLQARYKPNEKETRVKWERLEDMSLFMTEWDPYVFRLIQIVQRLKCLSSYHERSCRFIERVNRIYKQQCIIHESLTADTKTLNKCLRSIAQNKKQLKENCAYIKQRIKRLEIRTKPKK